MVPGFVGNNIFVRWVTLMPVHRQTLLNVLLVLMALLSGGCVSFPQSDNYPPEWVLSRGTPQPNGCPGLSGTYSTRAADVYPRSAGIPPLLNEIFELKGEGIGIFKAHVSDRLWPALPGATTASFKLDSDWLYVRFRDDSRGEAALKFTRSRVDFGEHQFDALYHCHESEFGPAMHFAPPATYVRGFPYLFAEYDVVNVILFKGTDGSLIINYQNQQISIPVVMVGSSLQTKRSVWWRYPTVESQP
jgi:hypothetical protein